MSDGSSQKQAGAGAKVPSELVISDKWDTCLEKMVINFGFGIVAGGLSAIVLSRSPAMRRSITAFGAGCGVGATWVHCSQEFEKIYK